MKKSEFIVECSQKILAGMMANPEKEPNPEVAIGYAEDLWDALIAEGHVKEARKVRARNI